MIQWTDCSPICSCSSCSHIASCCIHSSVQNRPKSHYPIPWLCQTVVAIPTSRFGNCLDSVYGVALYLHTIAGHFWPHIKQTPNVSSQHFFFFFFCLNYIPWHEHLLALARILNRKAQPLALCQFADTTQVTHVGRHCEISHIAVTSCRNHMVKNHLSTLTVWHPAAGMLIHREEGSGSHLGWYDKEWWEIMGICRVWTSKRGRA